MANKHIKDNPQHMSPGKCKLKQQSQTTTHLLKWPKSRILTTPNADENIEPQEHIFKCWQVCKTVHQF